LPIKINSKPKATQVLPIEPVLNGISGSISTTFIFGRTIFSITYALLKMDK